MSAQRTLLLDEQPLFVLPSLAMAFGVEKALFLQQLHYWLLISGKEKDGKKWIYNSLEEWRKQFPFWPKSTLHDLVKCLVKEGILLTANYNKNKGDRTLWYTIDYIKLDQTLPFPKTGNAVRESEMVSEIRTTIPDTTTDIYNRVPPLTLSHSNKIANEHNLSSNTIGLSHSNKSHSNGVLTDETVVPCTDVELWEVASRKQMSLEDVYRVHEQVLDMIREGNKYKAKTVKKTLMKWLDLGKQRGQIDTLTKEELMVLQWQNPKHYQEYRKKLYE